MADEIDLANEQAERYLQAALANRAPAALIQPRGNCHYCEADFEPEVDAATGEPRPSLKLFCDRECADGFEREKALRRRAGA